MAALKSHLDSNKKELLRHCHRKSRNWPRLLISNSYQILARMRLKKQRLTKHRRQTDADEFSDSSVESSLGIDFPEMSIFETNFASTSHVDLWHCNEQGARSSLYDMLWHNIERHENSDFIIRIGLVNFRCFSMVLSLYTPQFLLASRPGQNQNQNQNQHQNDISEYMLNSKIAACAFAKLYNWMLNEQIIITQRDVLQLVNAAEELNIEELKNHCWLVLDNANAYCEHVAYELYKDAGHMNLSSIQQLMMPRICKFFLYLVSMEDFLGMDGDEVCHWLSSNSIGVNSEMEVFYAAVLWVNSKWDQRRTKQLRQVMSCVRFGLVPPWFLVSLNATTSCPDVNRVVRQSKVKRLIADGLSLTTTLLFYTKNSVEFEEFLSRSNLKVPMQRKWIVDNACSYHYCEGSQFLRHINYEAFVDYLQSVRSYDKRYWRSLEEASPNHWSYVCSLKPDAL